MGSIPETLPVRRPSYLDEASLLPPAPPELDGARLSALFREVWARRDEPDQYVRQEPYTGGLIRVSQALRRAPDATSLSYRLAVGDIGDAEVSYQLTRTVQGIADAARMFDLPVREEDVTYEPGRGLWPELQVCGNTSAGSSSCSSHDPIGELHAGDLLAVAGRMTNDISGSLALAVLGDERTWPPPIDLVAEQRTLDFVRDARSLARAVVPLGRGGLLITLARCCALSELGAEVRLAEAWRDIAPVALLFGEAQSRCLVSLPREDWSALQHLARPLEVPLHAIGAAGGSKLTVKGAINLDLGRVKAWS